MDKGVGKLADAVVGVCGCKVYTHSTGCFSCLWEISKIISSKIE